MSLIRAGLLCAFAAGLVSAGAGIATGQQIISGTFPSNSGDGVVISPSGSRYGTGGATTGSNGVRTYGQLTDGTRGLTKEKRLTKVPNLKDEEAPDDATMRGAPVAALLGGRTRLLGLTPLEVKKLPSEASAPYKEALKLLDHVVYDLALDQLELAVKAAPTSFPLRMMLIKLAAYQGEMGTNSDADKYYEQGLRHADAALKVPGISAEEKEQVEYQKAKLAKDRGELTSKFQKRQSYGMQIAKQYAKKVYTDKEDSKETKAYKDALKVLTKPGGATEQKSAAATAAELAASVTAAIPASGAKPASSASPAGAASPSSAGAPSPSSTGATSPSSASPTGGTTPSPSESHSPGASPSGGTTADTSSGALAPGAGGVTPAFDLPKLPPPPAAPAGAQPSEGTLIPATPASNVAVSSAGGSDPQAALAELKTAAATVHSGSADMEMRIVGPEGYDARMSGKTSFKTPLYHSAAQYTLSLLMGGVVRPVSAPVTITTVVDANKTLWIETKTNTQAQVIRLDAATMTDPAKAKAALGDLPSIAKGPAGFNPSETVSTLDTMLSGITLRGSEQIDGTDAYVFEGRLIDKIPVGGGNKMSSLEKATMAFAKADGMLRQSKLESSDGIGVQIVTLKNVKINSTVEEDLFKYVPPPGANMVNLAGAAAGGASQATNAPVAPPPGPTGGQPPRGGNRGGGGRRGGAGGGGARGAR